jgi:hypothetical protein
MMLVVLLLKVTTTTKIMMMLMLSGYLIMDDWEGFASKVAVEDFSAVHDTF